MCTVIIEPVSPVEKGKVNATAPFLVVRHVQASMEPNAFMTPTRIIAGKAYTRRKSIA